MLAFTVAYKVFLLSLLSWKGLKNVKYLTEDGREECDFYCDARGKNQALCSVIYHEPQSWGVVSKRRPFMVWVFSLPVSVVLDQPVGAAGWGGAPESALPQATATASPAAGHHQAKPPSNLLRSHGISSAVRGGQLKMKIGWWQGVFPSNCQACYRGLKEDCRLQY